MLTEFTLSHLGKHFVFGNDWVEIIILLNIQAEQKWSHYIKFINPLITGRLQGVLWQKVGLARLIKISVNRSIYKRKTIIDMKIQKPVTFNGCFVHLFN